VVSLNLAHPVGLVTIERTLAGTVNILHRTTCISAMTLNVIGDSFNLSKAFVIQYRGIYTAVF